MQIAPFIAIRPQPNRAAHVASVPYDVVSRGEAQRLAEGHPESFLHVIRPEIDLPPSVDPYDDAVYARGRENLDRFVAEGVLVRDTQPTMYLYRLVMNHVTQTGIVCCCHVDDYHSDLIKKHEKTRPEKEDDRTRHMLALNAHTGPVFLTYRDDAGVDRAVNAAKNTRPLYHFDAPDGVTHTVWAVEKPSALVEAFGHVPHVYVADGHHRAASAARACQARRDANPGHTGDEHYNWFLTVLFPATQLRILAYNRLVRDLGGRDPGTILDAVREVGIVARTDDPNPHAAGVFGMYLDGDWFTITIDPGSIDHGEPIRALDVALLHDRILEPILGVGDARTDPRLEFVGGIRGTDELARRVDEGAAAAAFALYPTSIEQLMTVSDAGLVMPPKSTWFEPKLRSGLFVNPFGT